MSFMRSRELNLNTTVIYSVQVVKPKTCYLITRFTTLNTYRLQMIRIKQVSHCMKNWMNDFPVYGHGHDGIIKKRDFQNIIN